MPRVWLKTKITQIHALAKTRNHCFDQCILYYQHSYTNSAPLQRGILVLGKHVGFKKWAPRLKTAVRQKTRSLIASRLSTENRHFWLHLTQDVRPKNIFVHWLFTGRLDLHIKRGGLMSCCNTENFNYFWICEPLARCAKRGSSLPLGTPMEIDFTSAYLHYPLPQCSKIVTPIIISIS